MKIDLAERHILNRLDGELAPQYVYHDASHTRDVYAAVQLIAAQEQITGKPLQWLLTAALLHDTGFLVQAAGHEQLSCEIAKDLLPQFAYTPQDITAVCELIMATVMPQHPENILQQILCDADLDYLGREDFHTRSRLLYEEMWLLGTINSRDEFETMQLNFLRNHRYFTATSRRLREPLKVQHLNELIAEHHTGRDHEG